MSSRPKLNGPRLPLHGNGISGPAPLKGDPNTGYAGLVAQPAPSSLAFGVNIETVLKAQNHWREFYNPLRALTMPRAIALKDFARRGLQAELQNVYREMEGLYPTLIGLIERRTAPLLAMELTWKATPADKLPAGATEALADDQAAALRDAYEAVDNIYDAVEWLELGAFRGYAHLEKIYDNPGTSDFSICHLEPVEQWHWTRKSMYAEWEYVAAATQTNVGVAINYDQWIIREVRRPLDWIALILWIRASLCEKDWDAFIELYGLPRWLITMPDNVPPEKFVEYKAAAEKIAQGASGALPGGSTAASPRASAGDGQAFRPRLDWLQEQLVLAGTGGLLSMLSMPTGIGQGASGVHDAAFAQIAAREARAISATLNKQFDQPILDRDFPGQPRCAYFELSAKEETDVAAICAQALQLFQAGYQIAAEQLIEKTGYEITVKAPVAPPPGLTRAAEPGATLANRAPSESAPAFAAAAQTCLAQATAGDLHHAAAQLASVLEISDDPLREQKLKDLLAKWPGITADTLLAPQSADILANVIGTAYANGLQPKGKQ